MRGKYIVFQKQDLVCFSAAQTHREMASSLKNRLGEPTSAGAFAVRDGDVQAYGESVTLDLSSAPEDQRLFDFMFRDEYECL